MPDTAYARASGRVNLIGEHTDYHEGYVLPTGIPQHTEVSLERRRDRRVRASSRTQDDGWREYELGQETRSGDWLDYVQGVTAVLPPECLRGGFELRIDSTVPVGAGVSSSAALTVSLLRGLRTLFDLEFDDLQVAQFAQRAETDFVKAPVGMMDQMAASFGHPGEALFIDTRSLSFERLWLPETLAIGVIDSGISHRNASGGYSTRRRESFDAAEKLGVRVLRDALDASPGEIAGLPDPLARRARHIISENHRVIAAAAALGRADVTTLGRLLNESHVSMRDDYEITTPDIDALVQLCQQHPRVFGARMTGGGFGGAVVLLTEPAAAEQVTREIADLYNRRGSERRGTVLVPPPPVEA